MPLPRNTIPALAAGAAGPGEKSRRGEKDGRGNPGGVLPLGEALTLHESIHGNRDVVLFCRVSAPAQVSAGRLKDQELSECRGSRGGRLRRNHRLLRPTQRPDGRPAAYRAPSASLRLRSQTASLRQRPRRVPLRPARRLRARRLGGLASSGDAGRPSPPPPARVGGHRCLAHRPRLAGCRGPQPRDQSGAQAGEAAGDQSPEGHPNPRAAWAALPPRRKDRMGYAARSGCEIIQGQESRRSETRGVVGAGAGVWQGRPAVDGLLRSRTGIPHSLQVGAPIGRRMRAAVSKPRKRGRDRRRQKQQRRIETGVLSSPSGWTTSPFRGFDTLPPMGHCKDAPAGGSAR